MPSTTKIDMMEAREAPSVRRIAMSDCFSFTVITNVETEPESADQNNKKEDDPHHAFFDLHGCDHVRFCRDQSVA